MLSAENEDNLGIKSVALSNSVEVLFEHLKANLFSEGVGVFSERILITPSGRMQQWTQTQLASTLGVASGLYTVFLEKGVARVRERVFAPGSRSLLPSHLELFLEIEAQITESLNEPDPIWAPLVQYVQGRELRKTALALYLTQLFERYGTCAGKAAMAWQQKPSNWQEAIWAKVFSRWDYPQRALQNLRVKQSIPSDMSVHLFAFSYINPLYFHFFCQTPHEVPIYVYQLSPCQEFWSDLSSEHPSLLGSMGKMGRSMARLIEESGVPTEENYLVFGGETQLKRVQRDLLHLQSTETCLDDPSIQVHTLSTRREEIATLHNYLLALADKSGILPSDIIVMAPNIALYAPYIQSLFGKHLDYQITDMPHQKDSSAIEGLFLLLDLEKKRWSAPALLELFEHPLFRKKWSFTDDDLAHIRDWVRKTGIRWGVDGSHRTHLLNQMCGEPVALEEAATWMEGLGHLIEELAIPYEPTRIDFSQAETLGKTVQLIDCLYKETRELESEKTLHNWTQFFKKLAQNYFLYSDNCESLFTLFEEIEKAYAHFPVTLYSYSFVRTLLQECAVQKSVTINQSQLQAVRFCSMLPMRAIPAKVICLLGMDHDAFPRKDQLQALDLLGKHPQCGYSPSRIDFDRSLFLEALLSAREKLYISYLGQDPYDFSECPSSSVVAHLLPMISKNQRFKHSVHMLEGASIVAPTIRIHVPTALPQGEFEITVSEMAKFSRSFLGHYLHAQGFRVYEEETIQDEETFLLTPSRRAQLRQKILSDPVENVYSRIKREGNFPIGSFGALAKLQLYEEIAALPKQALHPVVMDPFELRVNSSLSVTFTGSLEGVFSDGMCVQGKKDLRTAAKAWPFFVLLNAYDSSKSQLLFAASNEIRTSFFDDPTNHLRNIVELFFYARADPLLLAVEWIEPILQQDPKKLAQAEHYDSVLRWYLRGKGPIDANLWIETYYPLINKVYGGMFHAWF